MRKPPPVISARAGDLIRELLEYYEEHLNSGMFDESQWQPEDGPIPEDYHGDCRRRFEAARTDLARYIHSLESQLVSLSHYCDRLNA